MAISISNNSLYSIGNVGTYAKNLVNASKDSNGNVSVSKLLGSTASGSISSTVKSNALFASQNATNMKLLNSSASALSSAAKKLTTGASALVSSDNKVVTSDSTLYGTSKMSFDVKVNNIATKQESASKGLSSSAASAVGAGSHSLTLATEKGSFNVDFTVKEGATNEESLNAMAKAINESKAAVTASVVTENGQSTLKLASNETGQMSAFELQGNVAETLGMETTQKAADANYSINGTTYTSASNTVSIQGGRGATMTLQGAGSASLDRGADSSKLVDAAKNFASAYNRTMSHLMSGSASGAGVTRALNLVADNRMTAMSIGNYGGHAASTLESMGISIDDNGMMQIDEDKLASAVQKSPNSVKDALAGYGGLATQTMDNVEQALRIPAATYMDFSSMGVESSLVSALMGSSSSTGSLFDILL